MPDGSHFTRTNATATGLTSALRTVETVAGRLRAQNGEYADLLGELARSPFVAHMRTLSASIK